MAFKFNPFSGLLDLVLDKASEIINDPSGSTLSATNVQDAVDELDFKIENLPNPLVYKGTWNAATNTPTLSNTDINVEGFLYQVQVAGTVDFGAGPISFEIGDKVVSNGTAWDKWDLTDAVFSVNGQTGLVLLDTADIPEDTNLYFTDERAQDAVGTILTNTSTVNLTYSDATPSISADVNDASITDAKLTTGINANKLADGSVSNTEFQYLGNVTSDIQTQFGTKVDKVTGDITRTSFSATTSPTPADVTGAAFAGTIRSFEMTMDAVGASEYECFTIKGIQKASDWVISQSSFGDDAGVAFSITTGGQIQYISSQNLTLLFKANVIGA